MQRIHHGILTITEELQNALFFSLTQPRNSIFFTGPRPSNAQRFPKRQWHLAPPRPLPLSYRSQYSKFELKALYIFYKIADNHQISLWKSPVACSNAHCLMSPTALGSSKRLPAAFWKGYPGGSPKGGAQQRALSARSANSHLRVFWVLCSVRALPGRISFC